MVEIVHKFKMSEFIIEIKTFSFLGALNVVLSRNIITASEVLDLRWLIKMRSKNIKFIERDSLIK